ncbi:hypothetical protein ACFQY7_20595 [Actinomadura luteofluorescens]|uniref:hypothetical protein n=1 Tax=Actinomadura luteofluorescens TaxID=46163 RepID=UPI0036363CA3
MKLDWAYFRRLYEELHDRHDATGRQEYLVGQRPTAAAHLAELATLREREPIPAAGTPVTTSSYGRS